LRPGKDPTGKLTVLPRPIDGFQEAFRGREGGGKGRVKKQEREGEGMRGERFPPLFII